MQGAQVIFYPTSIGWHPHEKGAVGAAQLDSWKTIQRAHAIANGCFVAVGKRGGYEGETGKGGPGVGVWGDSFVGGTPGGKVGGGAEGKGRKNCGGGGREREE